MNNRLLIIVLLALFAGACSPQQTVKPEEPVPAPPPPVVAEPAEDLKLPDIAPVKEGKEEKKAQKAPEKKQDEQYVMLNFENADIETVISTISEMLKINYILTPGVAGKITIQSHNKIPISELYSTFQTVLELNGFTAVKEGSFYRVVPIDTAKQQPVSIQAGKKMELPKDGSFVTQEIPLEFVKANDVANMLKNLMPRGTDIIVYEPSNMLIVTAPPSGMVKFMKLLDAIDIPSTERDSIKTFVYHVENGEAKKLAEILKNLYAKKGTGTTAPTPVKSVAPTPATPTPTRPPTPGRPQPAAPTAQPTSSHAVLEGVAGDIEGEVVIEAYDDINALLIKASPRAYLALLETIKKLDIQPKQVLIEVLVAEISLTDTMSLGIEWLLKTSIHAEGQDFDFFGGFTDGSLLQFKNAKPGLPISDVGILSKPFGAFAAIIDPKRFAALITAAARAGNVNVLASPNILGLDNKEAKIEVGSEVPVATSVTQAGVDSAVIGNTTSQVQFKSVGTILTVTPHINEKKQVTLKVSQEVSEIGDSVKIGGQDYTGFNTRKANTTAIVQDGHTLVIGGIIQERIRQIRHGIPFLSSIPILGYLFGTTTDETSKRELIILITPHVVADKDEADALTEEYRNRIKDVRRSIEKMDAKYRQSKIVPDNPISNLD